MNNGWIKLHRELKENPIYQESKAVHCWIECLLRARHKTKEVYLKRKKIKLLPGMFVMGREEFGKSIGMSGSTAWYWLQRFESERMVDIKKTTKGSIVTVSKWNNYQQVDNKKTTKKQQKNTNKKEKKEKKETYSVKTSELTKRFVASYNKIANENGFPIARKITKTRKRKINARIDSFGKDEIRKMFVILRKQSHLKNESWFNLDYVIKNDEHIENVLNDWMSWKRKTKAQQQKKSLSEKQRWNNLTPEQKEAERNNNGNIRY